MKKLLAGVLIYALTVSQVFGQAALLPNAKQTFLDTVGNPLVGGTVTFYVPGSTNKKTTWLDSAQTSNNQNPLTLDAAGRAVIYGQGVYRQVVKDANGNTIWDAPTTAYGSSVPSGANGTDTAPVGSIFQWSSFSLPINWAWANGQALSRTDFPDLLTALTITGSAVSCTASSSTLGGWSDTSQMRVGAPVEATCLPTSTTIASITNSSTIVVSNTATLTATVTATVFPWGDGNGTNTFNVPDLRGRVVVGSDTMNATAAGRLTLASTITTVSGSATASVPLAAGVYQGMLVTSANVPAGATVSSLNTSVATTVSTTSGSASTTVTSAAGIIVGMAVSSVNIPGGTTVSSISGTTVTMSANATATASGTAITFTTAGSNVSVTLSSAATATAAATSATFLAFAGANAPGASGGLQSHTQTVAELATHNHSITDPGHTHQPEGTLATSTSGGNTLLNVSAPAASLGTPTSVATTGITINNSGGGMPASILNPMVTSNFIIKVKANTTGAGGVVSWGGLFGDIATDATLQAYTSGGTNFAGLATQANATMLANVSGGTAQPTPTTWSAWMDSVCSSTRGSVIYRGASSWSCLLPPSAGPAQALTSAGADPSWAASGTGTVQSVGLALPGSVFTVSGSPVTVTGTLTGTFATQLANTVFAGPASGSAAVPGFRQIVNADLTNPATTVNGQTCTLGSTCTVGASAGTLTGGTLASNVLASSLTSVGTLTGGATGAGFTVALGTSTVSGNLPIANVPSIAANTVIGSIAGGTAAALSKTQITTLCNQFTTSLSGCVPATTTTSGQILSDGGWIPAPAGTGTVTSVAAGTGMSFGTITGSGSVAIDGATAANFEAGTANKVLTADAVFTAETTTTFGATQALDFSTFFNTKITLTNNISSFTCSNQKAGQSGMIRFIQDGTGSRTLPATFGCNFKFAGGVQPVLTTTAGAIDALVYQCSATNYCVASLIKNVQ